MGTTQTALGKMPPNAIELEEAVLGALMLDREALGLVDATIQAEDFYKDAHKHIYVAITSLAEAPEPVDLLTVTDKLGKMGALEKVGGGYYLVELTNRVASAANIEYHARIIKQKAIQRRIISAGVMATQVGYDNTVDVFEALEAVEKEVFSIANGAHQTAATDIGAASMEVLKMASSAIDKKGLTGVPGGLKVVDSQTGGWQPTDLIIIAGRPGMGKTAFAMQNAINAAMAGFPVEVYSLEMSSSQLSQRILSQFAGINLQDIRRGRMTERDLEDLKAAVEKTQGIPLYIDDTPGITLSALRSKARKAVLKRGVKMIVIDYIQLMGTSNSKNRDNDIGELSRGIKSLAKELNVPIIALSQLSRAVETRGGSKRPQLSDLRESGNLEQDADVVGFLYRPEYYGIFEDETGASLKGTAEFIFAKHRNGGVGATDPLGFKAECAQFFNLDEPQYSKPSATPDQMPNIINQNRPSDGEDIPF